MQDLVDFPRVIKKTNQEVTLGRTKPVSFNWE